MWNVWRPYGIAGAWPRPAAGEEPAGASKLAMPWAGRQRPHPRRPADAAERPVRCLCHRPPTDRRSRAERRVGARSPPLAVGAAGRSATCMARVSRRRPQRTTGYGRLHLQMHSRYNIGMSTTTVGFAVADEDQERLARLVEHFGGGNRSAYLRATLPVMEALARAERLRELQARNAERAAAAGHDYESLLAEIRQAYKGGKQGQ